MGRSYCLLWFLCIPVFLGAFSNVTQAQVSQNVITACSTCGAQDVYAADLTGDGRPDVLSASTFDDKIAWYKNSDGVLPVELDTLTARADAASVTLSWQTASESGNAGFEVQRKDASEPGTAWSTIAFVTSKAPGGTTSESKSYRYTDAYLPYDADRLSYRLNPSPSGIDTATTLSDPVVVERTVTDVELLGTFPNPAQSQATVRFAVPDRQEVEVRLYDALGRQVLTIINAQKEGRHEETIDVSGLPSGTYFLRLQVDGQTKSQQVTVVR